MGLTYQGELLVEAERISNDDNSMTGEILIPREKFEKLLSEKIGQKPSIRFYPKEKRSISSFEIQGCGWIIIESFKEKVFGGEISETSFMTLENKWW